MRVRAYDSSTGVYFKSQVFARLNIGWYEKKLLLVPSDTGGYVKFFDCFNKSESWDPNVLIQVITPDIPSEWIYRYPATEENDVAKHTNLLSNNECITHFAGYQWIYDDKPLLIRLLNGEAVPVKGSIFEEKSLDYKVGGWNFVETSEDIDYLFNQAYSFHEAVLRKLEYESGAYIIDDEIMQLTDNIRRVSAFFDCQQGKKILMVFEGVTALNLRPAKDNYAADISNASLYLKDASVFFCDGEASGFDKTYKGTWLTAFDLRWKLA